MHNTRKNNDTRNNNNLLVQKSILIFTSFALRSHKLAINFKNEEKSVSTV